MNLCLFGEERDGGKKTTLTQGGPHDQIKRGGKGGFLKWGILENFPSFIQ